MSWLTCYPCLHSRPARLSLRNGKRHTLLFHTTLTGPYLTRAGSLRPCSSPSKPCTLLWLAPHHFSPWSEHHCAPLLQLGPQNTLAHERMNAVPPPLVSTPFGPHQPFVSLLWPACRRPLSALGAPRPFVGPLFLQPTVHTFAQPPHFGRYPIHPLRRLSRLTCTSAADPSHPP